MPVRVKICGVTLPDDAHAAAAAGADYVGLNFWPGSPRALDIERARTVAAAAAGVPLVGVFVDANRDEVERVADRVGLSLLQFHGAESPAYCRGWSRPVIKAVRVPADASAAALAAPFAGVDYLLLDAWVAGRPGGTGQALAPAALAGVSGERVFLAGGLTPETVAEAVARVRPFAVDVASGVESRAGVKDHEKIRRFIERAKAA
jgi:phosphoribosylanthranilate isomerase